MARSWFLRRGLFTFLGTSFLYNAFCCPVIQLHPSDEKSMIGLRRRKYLSTWVNGPLQAWLYSAFGYRRSIWLFGYNQSLEQGKEDSEYLMNVERERVDRLRAAQSVLRHNMKVNTAPTNGEFIGFGGKPLQPEELPLNVRWRGEAVVGGNENGGSSSSSSSSSSESYRPPVWSIFRSMMRSALAWVPRTLTFNRPWGDPTGNSVQYNALFFEPVDFSPIKKAMVPVRSVVMKGPEGKKVKVDMMCQLFYRREMPRKGEVGHMKHGEVEALLDYVAPQVCDAWLASFSDIEEFVQIAPPFRRTATEAMMRKLPELSEFLLANDEPPPTVVPSLTLETPVTLENSIARHAKDMPHEELIRRYLAAKIVKRTNHRVAIDDIFWHLTAFDVYEEDQKALNLAEQAIAENRNRIELGSQGSGLFTIPGT